MKLILLGKFHLKGSSVEREQGFVGDCDRTGRSQTDRPVDGLSLAKRIVVVVVVGVNFRSRAIDRYGWRAQRGVDDAW